MSWADPGAPAATTAWSDPQVARSWVRGDHLRGLLDLPRSIVAELAALGGDRPLTVLDVGSGPGDFLADVLDRLPSASGIWTDISSAMEEEARQRLSRFGERVRYATVALDRLGEVTGPGRIDLVVSSRVTHHLDATGLRTFYAGIRPLLAPGGWIANLDHVTTSSAWDAGLRSARAELFPPNPSRHDHPRAAPRLEDHLSAIGAAGLVDVGIPWMAFWTVLIVARGARTE